VKGAATGLSAATELKGQQCTIDANQPGTVAPLHTSLHTGTHACTRSSKHDDAHVGTHMCMDVSARMFKLQVTTGLGSVTSASSQALLRKTALTHPCMSAYMHRAGA
jgi:hypothetical protein